MENNKTVSVEDIKKGLDLIANWMKAGYLIGEIISGLSPSDSVLENTLYKNITLNVQGNIDESILSDFDRAAFLELLADKVQSVASRNMPNTKSTKRNHQRKKQTGYLVRDGALLNEICKAGLIGSLRGVNELRDENGPYRVYSFDRTPEIEEIINAYTNYAQNAYENFTQMGFQSEEARKLVGCARAYNDVGDAIAAIE